MNGDRAEEQVLWTASRGGILSGHVYSKRVQDAFRRFTGSTYRTVSKVSNVSHFQKFQSI